MFNTPETTQAKTIHLGGNTNMNEQDQQVRPPVAPPQQKQIEMTSNLKQLLSIPFGIEPTGAIYTVTTSQFKKYFSEYFSRQGYAGASFANGKCKGTTPPDMYIAFDKHAKMIVSGKQPSERKEMLMGTRERGVHIRLDGKFRELVVPFCSPERKPYVQTSRNICYIQLDPVAVIGRVFGMSNLYNVALLDSMSEGGKMQVVYKFARQYRESDSAPTSIEDLLGC